MEQYHNGIEIPILKYYPTLKNSAYMLYITTIDFYLLCSRSECSLLSHRSGQNTSEHKLSFSVDVMSGDEYGFCGGGGYRQAILA